MIDNEQRVAELTRTLEDTLECFIDGGESWAILTKDDTLVYVHPDVAAIIEHSLDVLYNEEDRDDEDEDTTYAEL